MNNKFSFKARLWRYVGEGSWHFVTLPKDLSNDIKLISAGNTVGLGYVRVQVSLGRTIWKTTLFPTKEGVFYLAVKADVRKRENLHDGDLVNVEFELI